MLLGKAREDGVGTSLLIIVVALLLLVIYRLDALQRRIERLHVKVNAIRRAVVPDEPQRDVETGDLPSVLDTVRVVANGTDSGVSVEPDS